MISSLGKYSEHVYAITRIVVGFLYACHGAQKLFGLFGGAPGPLNAVSLAGGIIEFFAGVMIAAGFLAGIAAFIASGEMAVGYFMVHAKGGFFPIQNRGELAVVYAFLFLFIATRGSGIWSIDALLKSRKPAAVS